MKVSFSNLNWKWPRHTDKHCENLSLSKHSLGRLKRKITNTNKRNEYTNYNKIAKNETVLGIKNEIFRVTNHLQWLTSSDPVQSLGFPEGGYILLNIVLSLIKLQGQNIHIHIHLHLFWFVFHWSKAIETIYALLHTLVNRWPCSLHI